MPESQRLAIFVADFDNGGVERHLVNLARGAAAAVTVDFISDAGSGSYLASLPATVQRPPFDRDRAVESLTDYLRARRPAVLLSAKEPDDAIALRARRAAGGPTRVYLLAATHVSRKTAARSWPVRWWQRRGWCRRCTAADGVLAVSRGVAADLARLCGLAPERIQVLPNPTITPELDELARRLPEHPFARRDGTPLLLGLGRLGRAKDFSTLVRAFALLRRQRPARLVILGQGRQRRRLERLAQRLGVGADVALPGFSDNPYAWLARADLFVLSSRWEGMPNALIEALAVGTPVVATDCPSGPRELLQDGRLGALVPVGDAAAMAQAMGNALVQPADRQRLRAAVAPYRLESSSRSYLQALGLSGPAP